MKIKILLVLLVGFVSTGFGFSFEVVTLPNSFSGFIEVTGLTKEEIDRQGRIREEKHRRFFQSAGAKADRILMDNIISLFKQMHRNEITKILGPPQEITKDYAIPVSASTFLTVSGHQRAGSHSLSFFPVGDLGGIIVLQYEKRKTIWGGSVYLKTSGQNQKTAENESKTERRKKEASQIELIKKALEAKLAQRSKSAETQ